MMAQSTTRLSGASGPWAFGAGPPDADSASRRLRRAFCSRGRTASALPRRRYVRQLDRGRLSFSSRAGALACRDPWDTGCLRGLGQGRSDAASVGRPADCYCLGSEQRHDAIAGDAPLGDLHDVRLPGQHSIVDLPLVTGAVVGGRNALPKVA